MRAAAIRVRGQVQGVGFRPFVWRLAQRHAICGRVSNDAEGVRIFAQGDELEQFVEALGREAPPLARVETVEVVDADIEPGLDTFAIVATAAGSARTGVTPDAKICDACRDEIRDASARRHRYAFTNCTHCGPRFSIIEKVPYDRVSTTMSRFAMCEACRAEYGDPADRRFHAQPIACPDCGPRLWLEVEGEEVRGDPIDAAVCLLRTGAIVAAKALGGFHLVCDAANETAVSLLRERKRRPAKPFAVMAADIAMIERYSPVAEPEAALLGSSAAPVVLLAADRQPLAPSVAPGQWALGWMLPPTPLHQLLLETFDGPLIMTSGNLSGEPQVVGNDEARLKLSSYVDAFLMHDRDIARRLDDSVSRMVLGRQRVQRRARGYAPSTISLPDGFAARPAVAAYGGHLKSAICLTRDGEALLSHHLGDLDDLLTTEEFVKADRDYASLFEHTPDVIACDLHPDYFSTRHAETRADASGVPLVRVQHHHAHIAAVMAENGWDIGDGRVIGVALDGLGLGTDGTVWGGEFLLCDYQSFTRLAHLAPAPLLGGTMAQREPWRNLLAQLDRCGFGAEADAILAGKPLGPLRAAAARGVNNPMSTSAGRLFDAVASALGCAPDRQSFEGEAAMRLESLARQELERPASGYPFACNGMILDPAPMWRELLDDRRRGRTVGVMAARFHLGLAEAVAALAEKFASEHGAGAIALSGGCFQNATLLELTLARLANVRVLTHSTTPPNDGSLALGQAAVAAVTLRN